MKSGCKFQGTQKQIFCHFPCTPVMPDKGRQDRKQENITTQPGDCFKTIHNGGIQQSSGNTGRGWLLIFLSENYPEFCMVSVNKKTEDNHSEEAG